MKKLMLTSIALCLLLKVSAQDYSASLGSGTITTINQDNGRSGDPVRSKNYSKTFPADRNDKVVLSNQFGSMIIRTWDKREVKIDVVVKAYSSNEGDSQRMIDGVNVSLEKSGDQISGRTTMGNDSFNNNSGRRKREINVAYTVYLPATNSLTLSQQFGSVNMADFAGPLYAKVQYGNFTAGNLSNTNNYLSVQYGNGNIGELNKAVIKQQYGSGLVIGTVGTLDLNAQYASVTINTIKGDAQIKQQYGSGLKIGTVNNLTLNAQYTNVQLTTVKGDAQIKQQYNNLSIGSVDKLDLRAQYAGVTIGNLRGDGTFKTSYHSFKIAEVGAGCKNLSIDADYADVNLGFADNYNADFTVDKNYGGFKYSGRVSARSTGEKESSSSKNYIGKIGNGGSGNVRIKSDYGSVTFR